MRPYSLFDQVATTLAFIGFSLPTFFTGLLLILICSIWLDWLPFVYQTNVEGTGFMFLWEHVKQSIMRVRSEEHTSELQSLMRNSYAVLCLKNKISLFKNTYRTTKHNT